MVEEIFNYKAPIAFIRPHVYLQRDLAVAKKSQKRCSKEESIKMWQIKIDQIQASLDQLLPSKG